MRHGKEYTDLYDQLINIMKLMDMNAILQPHWDNNGYLDGGTIVNKGVVEGHIDPRGEEGTPGVAGIQ